MARRSHPHRTIHLIAITVVLMAVVWMPAPAIASTPPIWGEPVPIGADLPSSWFPDIDADAAGNVRLVWSSSLTNEDANVTGAINGGVMISELGADGWNEPSDIFVMNGGVASRPIITSDGQYAHMIFRWGEPGTGERLYYMRAPLSEDLSNAHSWSDPYPMSEDQAYWGQYHVLPDGSQIVMFNQGSQKIIDGVPANRSALFARRTTNQGATWGPLVRVSDTQERVARSSLTSTPDGSVVLAAWDEGYDNMSGQGDAADVSVARSLDGGVTWEKPRTFSGPYEQAVVSTDGETTVLIYRSVEESVLYYRTSDDLGRTWSEQEPIPGAVPRDYYSKHHFDKLSTAFDGDGRLLFTYVGADPEAPDGHSVMVATYSDGDWTAPQAVASPEGYPEYPRLAVALGNQIHLTYFVRPDLFELGHYTLWVMAGRSDAAAIDPETFEPPPSRPAAMAVLPTVDIAQPPPVPEPAHIDERDNVDAVSPQSVVNQPVIRAAAVTGAGLLIVLVVAGLLRRLRNLWI